MNYDVIVIGAGVVGWVAQAAGWSWTFLLLIAACLLSIFFMTLTCGHERGGNASAK